MDNILNFYKNKKHIRIFATMLSKMGGMVFIIFTSFFNLSSSSFSDLFLSILSHFSRFHISLY